MPASLAKYISDIRLRKGAGGREWFWKSNAQRHKVIAYALEYEPFTLLLKTGAFVQRRRRLAPLTFSHHPTGVLRNPADFRLFGDTTRPNSFEIATADGSDPSLWRRRPAGAGLGLLSVGETPTPQQFAAIDRVPALPSGHRKLIILHAFYEQEACEIFEKLEAYTDYDLMLTTPIAAIRDRFIDRFDPTRSLSFLLPNAGRDVLPLLLLLAFADLSGYRHFVKIHTKRSSHLSNGSKWFSSNVEVLVGQKEMTDQIFDLVDPARPSIYGLDCLSLRDHLRNNRHWLGSLIPNRSEVSKAKFIPGTMFAGSAEYLRQLTKLNLHLHQFEPENGQLDGCLVHALERYLGYFAAANGGACATFDALISSASLP